MKYNREALLQGARQTLGRNLRFVQRKRKPEPFAPCQPKRWVVPAATATPPPLTRRGLPGTASQTGKNIPATATNPAGRARRGTTQKLSREGQTPQATGRAEIGDEVRAKRRR